MCSKVLAKYASLVITQKSIDLRVYNTILYLQFINIMENLQYVSIYNLQ